MDTNRHQMFQPTEMDILRRFAAGHRIVDIADEIGEDPDIVWQQARQAARLIGLSLGQNRQLIRDQLAAAELVAQENAAVAGLRTRLSADRWDPAPIRWDPNYLGKARRPLGPGRIVRSTLHDLCRSFEPEFADLAARRADGDVSTAIRD